MSCNWILYEKNLKFKFNLNFKFLTLKVKMEKISPEDLKLVVSNLLDKEGSKKFENVVDIGTFLWKVVHKILETTNDKSLKLQQA